MADPDGRPRSPGGEPNEKRMKKEEEKRSPFLSQAINWELRAFFVLQRQEAISSLSPYESAVLRRKQMMNQWGKEWWRIVLEDDSLWISHGRPGYVMVSGEGEFPEEQPVTFLLGPASDEVRGGSASGQSLAAREETEEEEKLGVILFPRVRFHSLQGFQVFAWSFSLALRPHSYERLRLSRTTVPGRHGIRKGPCSASRVSTQVSLLA
jgi:hypothetical protein